MRAMYTAATGMMAQELNVSVISNNIANMRTTGYKRQRAEFQDLLYESQRRVGSNTSDQGTMVPTGIQVGSGVKTAATTRIMSQGTLTSTEKDLDVAIRGEGFFQVDLPDGRTAYTRDGSFELDANGKIVTVDGYTVNPGITIPNNASNITVNSLGQVSAIIGTNTTSTVLGQLQLARFVNKAGLEAVGDNLFLETAASGTPQQGTAGSEGFGNTLQRYLEAANVNSVTELTDLISAQRAYEMNARVVTAADEMLQTTASLSR
ncbi:flagellar basal-body rod protein FlgG [Blastochloris viridis]|uniref:Flagellar basal-body rod protein FlgG n=1 Tax=Blastochloris viridis TaxID=1079 RepID=A0A0H5B6W5_BLAVI|nr:flagellar basal-body rod protein FlgG [Blastochloris viridis]ALK08788.1 Flagellar basal-body rod protein FlgG [Blastochloris viridis]BAR97915.1 flagellar basal-body rod protein FlgG [Blastochloris viridis]CUU41449.1 Distal rod protein [Blastochloris viridis]